MANLGSTYKGDKWVGMKDLERLFAAHVGALCRYCIFSNWNSKRLHSLADCPCVGQTNQVSSPIDIMTVSTTTKRLVIRLLNYPLVGRRADPRVTNGPEAKLN
jgi:hypothetical protein